MRSSKASPRTIALSAALVVVTVVSAVVLNITILRSTSEPDSDPDVVAAETVELAADGSVVVTPGPSVDASTAEEPSVASSVPVVDEAEEPELRDEPSDPLETFQVGEAGEVEIVDHGSSLEFWSASLADGWDYQVEKSGGREVRLNLRNGSTELEWKAKLEGGRIRTELKREHGG